MKSQTGQDIDDAKMLTASIDAVEKPTDMGKSHDSINDGLMNPSGMVGSDGDLESKNEDSPERLVGNSSTTETVKALLIKRYHLYKRDRTGLCCEVAVPFICVIIGCLFNQIDFSQQSIDVMVTPSLFPTPQRITFNSEAVVTSDVDPSTLYANLPGQSSGDWEVTYEPSNALSPIPFYEKTFANR